MLNLKQKVFGKQGYSADLVLNSNELEIFRNHINNHWLSLIEKHHPELYPEAESLGIEKYHLISDKVDHQRLWHKSNRILPRETVQKIKQLPFFSVLKSEFGEFKISDAYDTGQHAGHEEIYWRLVRPHAESDVGPLHQDIWFHGAANGGYGMFSPNEVTVKVWIPISCEKGKSGLAIAAESHLREWKYHVDIIDGMIRPMPDEDLSSANAKLIPTEPGNALIFNEKVLHSGVLNQGEKTRVSVEITMVFDKSILG